MSENREGKRQMRSTRRLKASSETISAVTGDTWLLVCSNLYFSPSCVLKLMRTSKTIWLALKNNPVWWKAFFDRVVLYQSMLNKSNCIGVLNEFGSKTQNKRAVIHLVFSSECYGCEARFGHSIFKPLMKRLCQTCIHDNLISSRVLLYKYGIHFSDFILEYCDKGGVLMYHEQSKPIPASFLRATSDALDYHREHQKGTKLLFFEKTKLKEALGLDLDACFRRTRVEKAAVQVLFARFRRLRTQNFLIHSSTKHMSLGMEAARKHEVHRTLHPLKVCTCFMLGGPYYSFPTNLSGVVLQKTHFKLRNGNVKTDGIVRKIEACINKHAISLE